MRTLLKTIAHGFVVAWTLSRCFLLEAIIRRSGSAQALKLAFESLGVNWVKLGQALALRFDLLPADLCRELLHIRNDVRPFDYSEVKQIVLEELGRTPEQLFARFEAIPFAVTSSGQLHKATTSDGVRLVVKVQRASAIVEFRAQSSVMRALAVLLDVAGTLQARTFSLAVADFLEQRVSELSFTVAAANARKMAALAEDDPLEINITICSAYSRRRVLAWEFIDGVPVASITASAKASPSEFANDPSQPNQDFERIARQIYRNALNQIFRDGIFHADISAAGLLVVPSGSIAHVDFAVVGRLDEERQTLLQSQHENLLSGQVDESVDILIECAGLTSSFNHGELRRALAMVLEDRLDGFQSPSASLPREVAQNTYARLMSTFCEHGIVLPADLSLYFRTMMTMESLIFELSPDFDAVAEQSRFFSLAAREDYRQSLELSYAIENVARLYQDAVELVSDLRRLHNSAQAIDMSLRTLRTRLLQYCFWGVLVAVATYFGLRDEHLRQVMALKPFLLPGAFLGVAVFLFNRLWRQSRQLSRVDRAIVSTREIASRSLGRVR